MKLIKHFECAFFSLSILIFFGFSAVAQMTNNETMFHQNDCSAINMVFLNEHRMPIIMPDALIRDLYRTHTKNSGAIVQGKNRAILDKYFDKKLADLIWKDVTEHQDEVGVIDFDLFYNAQDISISNLIVKPAQIDGDRATVVVTFNNHKRKNKIIYLLLKENFEWKIADINYGKNETLLHYFGNVS